MRKNVLDRGESIVFSYRVRRIIDEVILNGRSKNLGGVEVVRG